MRNVIKAGNSTVYLALLGQPPNDIGQYMAGLMLLKRRPP